MTNQSRPLKHHASDSKFELNMDKKCKHSWITSELTTLACVLLVSMGFFTNGAFVGWSSYAMDFLPEMITIHENMRINSMVALGAALSPLVVHKTWYFIGTKYYLIAACFVTSVAWILTSFVHNYWYLLIGRALGGIAVGIIHFLVPLYINEIASPEHRSLYSSIVRVQFVAGILMQYALRLFGNILIVTLMPAIISSLLFIAFFIIPESPRFLSTRGNFDNAKTILLKFKSIDRDVESDVQVWSAAHHRAGFKSAFQQDFQFSQAISLFGVFLFEQLIGAISILFYLNKILTLTASEYTPELSAIVCGTAFAASIFLPYLISIPYSSLRSGLIWSNVLMGLCLAILGTFCHYQGSFGHIYTEDYRYLPLVCLVIFFSVYANGPSRLVQELADQIIPKKHDFTIRCLLTVTTWSLIYAITRNLPRLIDLIGVGWLFWFMTIMCFFATIFVKLFVPDLRKLPEESKLVESSESFSEA